MTKETTDVQQVEDVSNAQKPATKIFKEQSDVGLAEHHRPSAGLFFSSFAAGMEVGFSLFLLGMMYTLFHGTVSDAVMKYLLAVSYPIGFVLVVIGRSELFTEHTTLAVVPVLSRQANVLSLLRVWGIVYLGNILGGYLVSYIFTIIGPEMHIISIEAFGSLAKKLVKYPWAVTLGSAVIAGWLMGLLAWLVTSSQETISRIVIIFMITGLIGLGGLHHSIVGSIEVFAGLILEEVKTSEYIHFQTWSTFGNIIGGAIFVSVLKFGTIKLSS